MSRLPITIATWDYDRVRALTDGRVQVEGCDVNYITMPVEECFERAYFHGEFEVAEIGFSPFLIALSRGPTPYVALPVFLSRTFRHSAVYIRSDRGIEAPADLRGKRIGVPEYQMSAVLWFRGYLQDEFGIAAKDINWAQAGLENPGRRDKFPLNVIPFHFRFVLPFKCNLVSSKNSPGTPAILCYQRLRQGRDQFLGSP
jgi:4,5-dihydroxyphthalate decarboxylase